MHVLRVHYNFNIISKCVTGPLLQIVKSEREQQYFIQKQIETYIVFFINLYIWTILGRCFMGNQNWIYQEFADHLSKCHIYSEVLPTNLGYRMLPSPEKLRF
jgi:hypothetical protein